MNSYPGRKSLKKQSDPNNDAGIIWNGSFFVSTLLLCLVVGLSTYLNWQDEKIWSERGEIVVGQVTDMYIKENDDSKTSAD